MRATVRASARAAVAAGVTVAVLTLVQTVAAGAHRRRRMGRIYARLSLKLEGYMPLASRMRANDGIKV